MRTKFAGAIALVVSMMLVLFTTCGHKIHDREEEPGRKAGEEQPPFYATPEIPDSLFFMGERVPLERFDVYENLDREMLSNCYFHSQTMRLIKLAPRYFSVIDPILKEEGIPADFRYLAVAESSLNPRALSPAGAAGIWQFMKGAAGDYGLEVNNEVDERYHLEKATRAACRYLKKSYQKYGSWAMVAAAYNAGPGSVDRQIERQKTTGYFDLLLVEETERYVYRILSFKLILEDPVKYGFRIGEDEKYPLLNTRKVEITGPVADLALYAKELGITYKTLKYYNPWLRETMLTNKAGKRYQVEIPQ
ncbi:MAG TPA: lytic transglycosylase domain-containing protein [Prolixibacteraceae bacterium]|jgi:hypothetical protein|nr:lytic transglycosylase domain-containing protein [Bacteroidales bacterium]HNQ37155.1 lytic transglycosylase domain-containing protein [Prolixibacteraceae bacterium]HOY50734.1 lytic transglycosylase domain-containing protein [Prolixibacteraceae bacterium]HPJ78171.1 lytic transglycosylase domain-containing protein [Prolixibacteraceae bacterium]HRV89882.1 lytic transglycosylase domain-containing protein [Prolixibacteraceae bacterium]